MRTKRDDADLIETRAAAMHQADGEFWHLPRRPWPTGSYRADRYRVMAEAALAALRATERKERA